MGASAVGFGTVPGEAQEEKPGWLSPDLEHRASECERRKKERKNKTMDPERRTQVRVRERRTESGRDGEQGD